MKLTNNVKAGMGIALAVIALGVMVNVDGYDQAVKAAKVEAEQGGGTSKVSDLLTGEVEPGASVTTGVHLPKGARLSGPVAPVGPSLGAFTVDAVTYTDKEAATWVEVTATNTSGSARRFTAMIEYEAPQ